MKKDTKSLIKLIKYYKKYKFLCIIVIILSLGYAGISLLSPIYEGKMLGYFENVDKYIKNCTFPYDIANCNRNSY